MKKLFIIKLKRYNPALILVFGFRFLIFSCIRPIVNDQTSRIHWSYDITIITIEVLDFFNILYVTS